MQGVMNREALPLLFKNVDTGLSLFFATLCILDVFGIFPVIALPRAILQCGLYGIPLVLVVFVLQVYTAALLGKSWVIATSLDPRISQKNRYPLAAVTELTLGPRVRAIVTLLLDFTIFCSGIPNLLVASQNLQLFGIGVSMGKFDLSFCYWLLVVGVFLCPFMWLGSPRDMKWLSASSCVVIILAAISIWWCIVTDDRNLDRSPVPASPTWDKFISGYGMLAFQFDVHPSLMTVQVDMRQPRDIYKAVVIAVLVSGSLFGVTTGLAVWKYGGNTTANVLRVLPSGPVVLFAILLTALQLCFSSALGHSALFQHLEDLLQVERSFGWKRCATRSAVVFFAVAVAESVPRFDIVMALIGGTLIGPLVFILPPLIYGRVLTLVASRNLGTEIRSISAKRSRNDLEESLNQRVHSSSTYYGFPKLPSDERAQRYSYIYYDELKSTDSSNEDETEEFTDVRPILMEQSETSERRQTMANLSFFSCFVVLAGVVITISSTYINIVNTVRYVRFTPPCIVNSSVAQYPT